MDELIDLFQGILFLLILFGVPGLPVVLCMVVSGRRFARLDPLRAVAAASGRRLLGQSGLFDQDDTVRFSQGPYELSLSRMGRFRGEGRRLTEVCLRLGEPPPHGFFFQASTPEWLRSDDPSLRGPVDVPRVLPGDETGDERFHVTTTDAPRARALMNGRMRLALRQLDELFNEEGGYVGSNGSFVIVRKLSARSDAASLEGFHRVATTVADELLEAFGAASLVGAEASGLRRIPAPAPRPLLPPPPEPLRPGEMALLSVGATSGASTCGVCGVSVGPEAPPCTACGVRQHDDCWAYNGGCATYGCRGRAGRT